MNGSAALFLGNAPIVDAIEHSLSMGLVGSVAATAILIWSMLTTYSSGQRSYVDSQRRLPLDSGSKMLAASGAVGATLGVLLSFVWKDEMAVVLIVVVCCVAGFAISFAWLRKVNHQYLSRAEELIRVGQTKLAFEDASEVDRSSRALRPQAQEIMKLARDLIYSNGSSVGATKAHM